MTEICWLEQCEENVPEDNGWLSESENVRLSSLRFAKRRADWRLGRWTAKQALAPRFNVPQSDLATLEIRPAPSGAPLVFFAGMPAEVSISLSHRAGSAICAIADAGVALGCDLEIAEPRSNGFVADYFTVEEQALVAQASAAERPALIALLWSAKESALKAMTTGLRLDTRSVNVSLVGPPHLAAGFIGWLQLSVRHEKSETFAGWWQHNDGWLRTVVAHPCPGPPVNLKDRA